MFWRRSERVVPVAEDRDVIVTTPDPDDLQAAYDRGRRDERRPRTRPPRGMTLPFAAAAGGVVALVRAAPNGSFQRGGAALDRNLEVAADRAEPVVRDAVSDTGDAISATGRDMKEKAADSAG
jgi:hypothetical protein